MALANIAFLLSSQFEEFEKNWESDSDEEAFVDQLALQMLEDSADGGPDDPDEHPEMVDWGVMYENGKGEKERNQWLFSDADDVDFVGASSSPKLESVSGEDEDAFMDELSGESDGEDCPISKDVGFGFASGDDEGESSDENCGDKPSRRSTGRIPFAFGSHHEKTSAGKSSKKRSTKCIGAEDNLSNKKMKNH